MRTVETLFLTGTHFNPDEAELAKLKTAYPYLSLTVTGLKTYTLDQLAKAEIIVGTPDPKDLKVAKNLKWMQTQSSGVTQFMTPDVFTNGEIILTNAKGTYGRQIADHVIGSIIAFNHNLLTYHDQMKQNLWKAYFPKIDIWNSTILIIGFGDIGQNIAIRAKAHGMKVIVVKRTAMELPECVDEIYTIDKLDSVLPKADYVAVCVAATAETENMLNEDRLKLMKKGSMLINVGRGSLVDEQALITLLENGYIGSAALDVTQTEPLGEDSRLWSLENVLITPHASGFSYNDPHFVFDLFFENLGHYLGGETLKNQVDFSRKY